MAVGFTPKHVEEYPLADLTKKQFLVLAIETALEFAWKIDSVSENGFIAVTDNGMFSWNAEVKIIINNESATIVSISLGNEMMDWGKNKQNIAEFIENCEEIKNNFSKEEFDAKYGEIKEQMITPSKEIIKSSPNYATDKFKDFLSIFKPTKDLFYTPVLIDLNIIIFILMSISGANIFMPDSLSLLNWGANFRPMTLSGDWWRLFTSCFLHIGILHLFMNMYALLFIGILLEPLLGRTRYISAYFLTGIASSLASLSWHGFTISAGASGAIFGLYGVFLALLSTDLIEKTARKKLFSSIGIFVAFNLIYGLKSGIDNAGHVGGLLSGILIGFVFIPSLKRPQENNLKHASIGLLSIILIFSTFYILKTLPNDYVTYESKMSEFTSNESKALEVYDLPQNTPNENLLYAIKSRGIYYWKENIKILESCKVMDLPKEIKFKIRLMKEYCELRIKSYELLYKSISEETDKYKSEIEDYDKQINSKIKEIERV